MHCMPGLKSNRLIYSFVSIPCYQAIRTSDRHCCICQYRCLTTQTCADLGVRSCGERIAERSTTAQGHSLRRALSCYIRLLERCVGLVGSYCGRSGRFATIASGRFGSLGEFIRGLYSAPLVQALYGLRGSGARFHSTGRIVLWRSRASSSRSRE
jgi:hypothetical protein